MYTARFFFDCDCFDVLCVYRVLCIRMRLPECVCVCVCMPNCQKIIYHLILNLYGPYLNNDYRNQNLSTTMVLFEKNSGPKINTGVCVFVCAFVRESSCRIRLLACAYVSVFAYFYVCVGVCVWLFACLRVRLFVRMGVCVSECFVASQF